MGDTDLTMKADDESKFPSPRESKSFDIEADIEIFDDDDNDDYAAEPSPHIHDAFSLLGKIVRRQIHRVEHDDQEVIADVSDDSESETYHFDEEFNFNDENIVRRPEPCPKYMLCSKPVFQNSLSPFADLLQRQIDRLRGVQMNIDVDGNNTENVRNGEYLK